MRLTIVTGAFLPLPPGPSGAVEKVWTLLADEFVKRGHEVTFVARSWDGQAEHEEKDGIRYIRTSGFNRSGKLLGDLWLDFRYARAIRRCLPPADVTVSNCFWLPALLRKGSERGLIDHHLQRFPKRQMWLYKHVDRISTVSQIIADAVATQTPSVAGLLDVVGNPVDTSVFHPSDVPPERLAQNVMFHGRVHPEKGLAHLVDAIRIAAERDIHFKLTIIGPHDVAHGGGGIEYLEHLKQLADGLEVDFVENIADQRELAERLRECDIHCYPSLALHGEASPVSPLEALACGAVPVVSNLPQFEGYVRDGETGIVFELQGEGIEHRIADALIRVATDDALRARLREGAIACAHEFAVPTIADKHLAAWQSIMDQRQ